MKLHNTFQKYTFRVYVGKNLKHQNWFRKFHRNSTVGYSKVKRINQPVISEVLKMCAYVSAHQDLVHRHLSMTNDKRRYQKFLLLKS